MGGCCVGDCCVMDNAVGDFFRDLICSYDCSVGSGYSSGTAECEKKVAEELEKMKENMRKLSTKAETRAVNNITSSMAEMLKYIESINNKDVNGVTLNLDIKKIQSRYEDMKGKVPGTISKVVDDRIHTSDPELSTILEELDDEKRKRTFEKFCDRVFNKAVEELQGNLRKMTEEINTMVEKALLERIKELDKRQKQAQKELKDIMEKKKSGDTVQLKETWVQKGYEIALLDLLAIELQTSKN